MGDNLQEYYSSVCRTCLQSSNGEMKNLSALIGDNFLNGNEKISYMNCLQYCLTVEDDVGGVVGIMPTQICIDCASALQVSYWFMKNANKAQELLKVRLKELQDKHKEIERQAAAVEEQRKPKRYRCKICNTKLETKRSLKDHVKLHLDIIAYNCQLCDFEHHQRNHLIEHYQLQHGVEATPEQLKPKTKTTPPIKRKATPSTATSQFKNFVAEQQLLQQQQQHQQPYEVFMEPLPSQNSNDIVYTTQQLQQQQQNQNFVYTSNTAVNTAVVTTPLDGNGTTTTIYAQPNGETFTFNTFDGDLNVQNDVNVGNEFIVMADGTVENVLGKGVVIEYINTGDDGSLALGNGLVLDNILQVQNADTTNMILATQQNDVVQMDVDDLIIEDPENSPEQTQDVPSPVDEDMIPATFIEQQPKRNNCKICAKEFDTQDELKNHMLTHNEIPHFFCDHCTFYTFFKIDLHQHYKSKHNLQPTNKQLQPRNKQQKQHNSETDMDPQTKNAIVQKIERYARSQRLVYCCDICYYECDLKYDIRRHYLTKHRMHIQDIQQVASRASKNIQPLANKQAAGHGDHQKAKATVNIAPTEELTPDYPNGLNCRKCNEVFYMRNKLYEHYKLHDAEEEALKQQRQVIRVQKPALNNIPQQLLQMPRQEKPEMQLQTQQPQQPEMQLLQQSEIQLQLQQPHEPEMQLQLQPPHEPEMQLQLQQQQHSDMQLQPELQLQQPQLPEIQLQLQLEQQPEMHLQLQQQQPEMQLQLQQQQQQQPEMQLQLQQQQQPDMQLQQQPEIQLQLQPQLEEPSQQQQVQILQQLPQPHQEVVITTTPLDNTLPTFNNVSVDPMSLVLSQNNNTINNTAPLTPSSSSTYTLPSDAIPQVVEMEQTIETDMDFDFNGDALFEDFDDVDVENESEDNDLRNIVLTSDDDFDDMLKEQSETQTHTTPSYCAQCQKSFLSQYQFENHMFLHRGLAPYRCEMCTNLYNTKRALIRHYNAVHKKVPSRDMIQAKGDKVYVYDKSPTDILNIEESKATTLMCAKCTYESTDFPSVQLHLNTNHSIHEDSYILKKLPFECPRCIRSFATKAKLVRHLERNHSATPINHPQVHINSSDTATTTTTTTTAPSLNNNVNMMQMNATCEHKGFTDAGEGQRDRDIETETTPTESTTTTQTNYNSNVPIEQCIAPSSFVMASLHGHTSPKTSTAETNTDLNISPSTSTTSTINTELDSSYSSDPQSAAVANDAVLYKCQKCHMTCTTIDSVRQHGKNAQCRDLIKLSNKDHPLFKCEICNTKYPTMYQLRFHLKRHMTRPFSCPCCPKAYVNKVELETHQRTHTNERPYQCDKCPNSFRYAHHLKRHKDIIHFGKRYICPEANCNRQFTTLDQLKIHKWSHCGIVPYKCKYCERLFKKRLLLRKHCWKFHKRYLTDDEMAQNFRNSVGYTKAAPFEAD